VPYLKQIVAAAAFLVMGVFLMRIVPSVEVAWVTAILLLTIYLFTFEITGIDVVAITIMVVLGLTSVLAPLLGLEHGLVPPDQLFNGFSSNAVISIIAVMIIGAGLDKTGLMAQVATWIVRWGGSTKSRVIPILSGSVSVISSFMQNVGAAALFLPVVNRISGRTGIAKSQLLMPMGFCAILGGTLTMIGSSPLILLNDLILTSSQAMSGHPQMHTWSLFSVTPIGAALVLSGIAYFVLAGRYVLPEEQADATPSGSTLKYFRDTYGLEYGLIEVRIPANSELVGKTLDQIEHPNQVRVVAAQFSDGRRRIGPGGLDPSVGIDANTILAVMGLPSALVKFVQHFQLGQRPKLVAFAESLSPFMAGIAELVIPPGSQLIGKTAREVRMRNVYGLSLIALHRAGENSREGQGVRDIPLQAGDTLVCHVPWSTLAKLENDRNFVVMTQNYPREILRPHKVGWAVAFLVTALVLVLFTNIQLSIALLTGAMGMVLSRVLSMEEAYAAVSWKTVFLLASLLPLGMAVESSGTAAWIAAQSLALLDGVPIWGLQLAVAVLATVFTLVMSNVGATVLLVPLAINIAIGAGGDPAVFALIVAIATSNSFLLPTHQVNALIMGPAGYRVIDFIRAGGIMTLLFLVVLIAAINILY